MSDHTHCSGVGTSLFCCPSGDPSFCSWRGFDFSGDCLRNEICNQAKFGSLRLLCFAWGNESNVYAACEWSGEAVLGAKSRQHARCLGGYEHFVVAASQGFGGD